MNFIPYPTDLKQDQRGLFFDNNASESAYHVTLLR